MAPPLQRVHVRSGAAALSFVKRPPGFLGNWGQAAAGWSGAYARYMGPDAGTAQLGAAPAFAAIAGAATQAVGVIQLLGDPLRRQDLAAGTWQVGFAAKVANASATFAWGGRAALYVVNGLTGARRGTVFNVTAIGSAGRTGTGELTCYATVAGSAVSVLVGDYLALELGVSVANAGGALAPQVTIYSDGSTLIGADGAAATDARSGVSAPAPLLLSLPVAGEQPTPTVTHEQALRLLTDHYPPGSDRLYDWDNPSSPIGHLLAFLADCIKLYGFDATDRLLREVSPLTCVEVLPVWEKCFGLSYSKAVRDGTTVPERRALLKGRFRENGPLTLFNVAAAVGPLAGYAAPDVAEVLEVEPTDLYAANVYTDSMVGSSNAIPVGTGFDASNLVRYTPTRLDGGVVWPTGVLVLLSLGNANTSKLHVQLTGPDYVTAQWSGCPDGLDSTVALRSPAHSGKALHGAWRLNIYREVGAPANTLASWALYTLGWTHGGRGGRKLDWAVYLDSAHQSGDRRALEALFSRITQLYARSWILESKSTCYPGSDEHRPGRFLPG